MKTSPPLVSILLNNYNYGRYLRDAINSALSQTYPNFEVIVVDDGSSDSSREIIATYGSRVISVLKENGGQGSAFNAGFAASKGEWIHLLDSDDVLCANTLERILEMATAHPLAGLIAHNVSYCTENRTPMDYLPPPIRHCHLVDDRRGARRGRLTALLPATSGLCVRRDVLAGILPMPEEIRITADAYLRVVAASLTPILLLPEPLAIQRIHGLNLFTLANEDKGKDALFRCTSIHAVITFHLRKEHPSLSRLAWKQYGYLLYQFMACRTKESRKVERDIRNRYSVLEWNPLCILLVFGVFAKRFVNGLFINIVHSSHRHYDRWPAVPQAR